MVFSRRRDVPGQARKEEDEAYTFDERLVTVSGPASAAAKAYRDLRTNLLLYTLTDEPPKVIVLTSPGPCEDRSTTCANLGVVLAQASKNTLIIDFDFRKPALHKIFGLHNSLGIVDALVGKRSLQEVCQEPVPGLKVVCSGLVPPEPAEVLGIRHFAEFLHRVRQEFDYVLIDIPPVEVFSGSPILASKSDGVLLVLDARKTSKESIHQSMRKLEGAGAKVLGTVVNNAKV